MHKALSTVDRTTPGALRNLWKVEPIISLASHLEELQRKHGDIEHKRGETLNQPSVDDLQIVLLKCRKLALKDEIERVRDSLTQH